MMKEIAAQDPWVRYYKEISVYTLIRRIFPIFALQLQFVDFFSRG